MLWGIYSIFTAVRSTTNAIQEQAAARLSGELRCRSVLAAVDLNQVACFWPATLRSRSPGMLNDCDKQRGHFPQETGRNSWGNTLYKPEKKTRKSLSCREWTEDEKQQAWASPSPPTDTLWDDDNQHPTTHINNCIISVKLHYSYEY